MVCDYLPEPLEVGWRRLSHDADTAFALPKLKPTGTATRTHVLSYLYGFSIGFSSHAYPNHVAIAVRVTAMIKRHNAPPLPLAGTRAAPSAGVTRCISRRSL